MLRHPLFILPAMALLAVADGAACLALAGKSTALPPAAASFLSQLPSSLSHSANSAIPLGLHAALALPASLLGAASLTEATKLTRFTLGLFFLVLTLTIPVIGILITAALALILRQPSLGGLRPEERFVFGNPEDTAARRESRDPHPNLIPLAARFRDMDEDTLCRAILGLKHLGPVSAIAPFLRRFQQDPRTSVQFSAQAVLTGATEALEETVRTLRARAAADPRDPETALALASTLDQLAGWTPPGDTTAALYRRDATALLLPLQNHPALQHRILPLLACQQLTTDPTAALQTTAAAATSDSSPAAHLAHLQSLFQQARWEDLAAAATQLPLPPGHAESQAFWTQPGQ